MRIRKVLIVVLFGVGLLYFTSIAMALDFKEGQWSMTVTTKMDNISPEMADKFKEAQAKIQQTEALTQDPQIKAQLERAEQKMAGMSQGETTQTITQCLTKQNFEDMAQKAPGVDQNHCQFTHDVQGDTFNFHSTCTVNGGQVDTSGAETFTGDSLQAQLKSHGDINGKTIDSTIDITGQYVGPC